jgi:hypothetical protein
MLHVLSVENLFDSVSGHGVEEEDEDGSEEDDDEELDDHPLVVVPQDVAQRLEWVHEPHERRVWATETTHNNNHNCNVDIQVRIVFSDEYD